MKVTLVVPSDLGAEIERAAQDPLETAGVLLAKAIELPNGDFKFLAQEMHWVAASAYLVRRTDRLSIGSDGYVPSLARAEEFGSVAFWVHTHPNGGTPRPSSHDRLVDGQLESLFRGRSNNAYYGALIFSSGDCGLTFTGHVDAEGSPPREVDRLWLVGDRFRSVRSFDSEVASVSAIFDRNVRAFGGAVQSTLSELRIGIVGCGGTGSAVAEQLVRLGVREISLVDPDRLSLSNITRVYGSTAADVGRPKVEVLAEHLRRIAPAGRFCQTQAMITVESAARQLMLCDIVFGCTDDNAGRLVLSRLPAYLLTPVIDCGVLLTSDSDGKLIGIDGRVTVATPGTACLVCRDRIDIRRASAELLTPEERRRRQDEGYAPALEGVEPAVVTFTTLVSATAVNELLERLIGYGPQPRPSEVLLRIHDREISTNAAQPREGHYCHPAVRKIGHGVSKPFLEMTWSA